MTRDKYKVGDKVTISLPDGNVMKVKIIEIIPESKSKCYLVQYNNAYALISQKDIIQKS